jgi:hypothetical protein
MDGDGCRLDEDFLAKVTLMMVTISQFERVRVRARGVGDGMLPVTGRW